VFRSKRICSRGGVQKFKKEKQRTKKGAKKQSTKTEVLSNFCHKEKKIGKNVNVKVKEKKNQIKSSFGGGHKKIIKGGEHWK